ncbi:MAG TPA: sigma-70 family RNA polymerase sigma factor, partial [Candidatus Dormibacteraeota bacterium]|nr:sigma-70 family RNA polymerase sigma factor [Candidatus Dormibacteraeota bacterium]
MTNDQELLSEYVIRGSEAAFAELVSRHLPLVYSAALRQLHGNQELAKDVAQTVFISLARKARSLTRHKLLTGWLYTSTRFASATVRRSEARRQTRERVAAVMQANDGSSNKEWEQLVPVLDEAMHELSADEQFAVLLRFFERKELKQVGAVLGISEDAARMRIARALGKLQGILNKRGVAVSAGTLGLLLAAEAVKAAPSGVAVSIRAAAAAGAGSGMLIDHLFEVLKTNYRITTAAGAAILLMVAVIVKSQHPARTAAATEQQQVSQNVPGEADRLANEMKQLPASTTKRKKRSQNASGMRLQLLDSETGAPPTSARISIAFFSEGGHSKARKFQTDDSGVAWVQPDPQPFTGANLFVTADGHVPKVVTFGSGDLPEDYIMKLEAGSAMGGIVSNEAREPVADVKIEFETGGIDKMEKENIQFGPDTAVKTDDHGHWSCNMIPKGLETIQLVLSHKEFATTVTNASANVPEATNLTVVLAKGVSIAGTVANQGGQPIKGASVREVHNRSEPHHSALTDEFGKFTLNYLRPQEIMLAIQAKGFSPEIKELVVSNNPVELKVVLGPGHLLRGRVLDESGTPISNAVAQTDWDQQGVRKLEWTSRTDTDGRFEWDSAPAEPLLYWFEASGRAWHRMLALKADGSEHEIKLQRDKQQDPKGATTVTGTAIDADTGQPLDTFRVLLGQIQMLDFPPDFSFLCDGKDGRFSARLEAQQFFATYQIQITKDDYLPAVSTNLSTRQGSQALEFQLLKGSGPAGVVLLPGGEPAANCTVFMYEAVGGVYMDRPGHVRKEDGITTALATQPAAEGRFRFSPRLQARGLMVIHEQGYAQVGLEKFNRTIPVQRWGRVEGRLLIGNTPGVNEKISLGNVYYRFPENGRHFPPLSLWL